MEKYEDKIYSLGEAVTGQTQAMSHAVQKTLKNNTDLRSCNHYTQYSHKILFIFSIFIGFAK